MTKEDNELAGRIIAADLIKDFADSATDRRQLADKMDLDGVKSFEARGEDGTVLGKVSYSAGKPKAKVVDDIGLKKWVQDNHPDCMMAIIDPAYVTKLLNAAAKEGVAHDPSTGESLEAFIDVYKKDGYVRVVASSEATAAMANLLEQSGLRQLTSAPELPPAIEWDL